MRSDRWVCFVLGFPACCFTGPAGAAPFCTQVTGLPTECLYSDAAECSMRARQLGGTCVGNPAEFKVVGGSGRFCLVDSNLSAFCAYPDRDSCDSEAARKGEVCIDAMQQGTQRDIYQTVPGRRY